MCFLFTLTEGPVRKSDPTSAQRPQSANQSLARWMVFCKKCDEITGTVVVNTVIAGTSDDDVVISYCCLICSRVSDGF